MRLTKPAAACEIWARLREIWGRSVIDRCLGMCYRAACLAELVLKVLVPEVLVPVVLVPVMLVPVMLVPEVLVPVVLVPVVLVRVVLVRGLESEDPMVESIWESSSTSALPLFRPPSLWMSFPVLRCLKRGVGIRVSTSASATRMVWDCSSRPNRSRLSSCH